MRAAACSPPERGTWPYSLVPKAGTESTKAFIFAACGHRLLPGGPGLPINRARNLTFHEHYEPYKPCNIANVREPCERARLVVLVHVYLLDRVVRELDLDDEKQRRHS